MPELYALSLQRMDRIRRGILRPRERSTALVRRTARSAGAAWPGAFAFVWKAWLKYRRRTTALELTLTTALPLAAGFAAGRIVHGDEAYFALLATLANVQILFASIAGAVLARELRRPIFWLAGLPLFARLAGTVSGTWVRTATIFWCGAAGAAVGGAPPVVIAVLTITLPALGIVAAGAGTLSVALLPAPVDQRGPAALLRPMVTYAALAPALAAFGVAALYAGVPVATAVAAAVAALEGFTLIALAAWRFDGRVDRLI